MRKAILLSLLVFALMGCEKLSGSSIEFRKTEPRQKISIAYTFQPQSTLVHVAIAKGYFADEGLDVLPLMHTYGKLALQDVIDKRADFSTVAETPVMFSVLKGEMVFVVANIESSTANNGVVARRDADISAPGDLKGKRIGFTPGTTSDFFLDSFLTANGLTRKDIQPVALKPEEMHDSLMVRKVDAVCTWNYPLTQIRRRLGPQGVVFFDREIYTETFNIAARQDYVLEHPLVVKRLLRALIKSEGFVADSPVEAQAIMAAATKLDQGLVREVWDAFQYKVVLDQGLLITLEDETRWAMKNKLVEQVAMPDYRKFIHSESLAAIKPEAVTLNR